MMMAYGTSEGFAAYLSQNGYDAPTGSVDPALARASAYIDAVYGARFIGQQTGGIDQEMEWPRTCVPGIPDTEIPARVERATYAAARLELASPGSLDASVSDMNGIKRLQAGSVEIEYADASKDAALITPANPDAPSMIDGILAPLLLPFDRYRMPEPVIFAV